MFKRTFLMLPAVMLLGATLLTGCGDKQDTKSAAKAPEAQILRVGTNATFAPFEFQGKNTTELDGFDMDLIRALAKQMGRKIEIQNSSFDGLIPALSSGNIDLAISGMTINDQRKQAVNFSKPYYDAGLIVLVREDNNDIKSIDDLKGKSIGAQLGTTGALEAEKVPGAKVVTFNDASDQFLELNNKGVEACINDYPVVAYYLQQGGKGKMVGKIISAEQYGIALKKGNDALTQEVDKALDELIKSGEYNKIYEKWFGKKIS